ncbi:sterile alpha motif domain-containing protein 9-like [Alligator mississippiensis]|uniref:sterile alpha motif domain-containing protein 9-like n=1 Tax=Alligator mississippiensis TaxID=8496 RepID=UPI000712131B|nr:sterile alpha motif domain-containing protein 9-like [Alligator mississippiensis]
MPKRKKKNPNTKESKQLDLSQNIEQWTKEQVNQWVVEDLKIDPKHGEILLNQDVTGCTLRALTKQALIDMGITHGPALQIIYALKQMSILTEDPSQASGQEDAKKPIDEKDLIEKKDEKMMEKNRKGDSKPVDSSATQECKISAWTKPLKSVLVDGTENKLVEAEGKTKKLLRINQLPTGQTCLPYPFDEFHASHRYIQGHSLSVPETGPLNLIDPAHEFKKLRNTENATEENIKLKFTNEVFRFASACMNSRTNGTIHFGVLDNPHGEIIGVEVRSKDIFIDYFNQAIKKYFGEKYISEAKACIREPRFVEVLLKNNTPSNTFVIEVDVVPRHSICGATFFQVQQYLFKTETWEPALFVRDGASSKNIIKTPAGFKSKLQSLADARQAAEKKHAEKTKKKQTEGLKLRCLLTGNQDLLDNSYYDWYILVTNKCHPSQTQHLEFLQEIKWFAVLEFDSESVINGVVKTYRQNRAINLHFPNQYQIKGNLISEVIEKLNLYHQPSWIFCNGRSDLTGEKYQPLEPSMWQRETAAEVRKLISFLSHKDLMQRGKFLVVFLLLSTVEDPADPLIETFTTFYQELKGLEDMLCICIGAQTYQRWKDLLQARFIDAEALTKRCISNLNLEMVNGTILKLKSVTQSSRRFLPSVGSSTILLKKGEDSMTALEILCENECKDTEIEKDKDRFSKFKKSQEEHFYRGGKVSWWNFYFSSENYSSPFIKRDSYEKLEELIQEDNSYCVPISTKIINLYHHPGCGGTTLAMHVLWELKKKFRCAILKNKSLHFAEIGKQLANLITYGATNQEDYFPVLLLVDDFEEQENVYLLQNEIQSAITNNCIRYENPLVIILNCMRSQNPEESSKSNGKNSIALKHQLSRKEQRAFEDKLKEIEKEHQHPEDFYSFMIMKKNFDKVYIENVVRNTLKGLDITSKQAQLISFLALLNSYVTRSTISVSQCEEFLGIAAIKTFWRQESLEEKMGTCSNILIQAEVQECGKYKGMHIIHPLIADHCLEELKLSYNLSKSEITMQLLRQDLFYESGIGREKLLQDVQIMLITRQRKEHGDDTDTLFSPLIETIQKEEMCAEVENVLKEGTLRFSQNAFICQALARHFYIKKKNFDSALKWAKEAKKRAPSNSYVSDTLGQVFKSEIIHWVEENVKRTVITVEELEFLLNLAKRASEAFKESQQQTESTDNEQEGLQHLKSKRRYYMYNTAGYLGEIETGLYTINIIKRTPFFNKGDPLTRKHMAQYFSGNCDLPKVVSDTDYEKFWLAFEQYTDYLSKLKSNLKRAFDFFMDYFVFLKPRSAEKETVEFKIRTKVRESFKKYVNIFCYTDLEQLQDKQICAKLSLSLQLENYRRSLEASKADKFSGLLEYLGNHEHAQSKMEDIVHTYTLLLKHSSSLRDKQNFILANIVLNCINPNSMMIPPVQELREQLRKMLQQIGPDYHFSQPYFLATLLFWPENQKVLDEDSTQMEKYITSLKKVFRGQFWSMRHSRQPIAHFYLGKSKGLKRLVHKGKIDQCSSSCKLQDLYYPWQSGAIWKEEAVQKLLLRLNGKTEDNIIYVDYGINENMRIPVRPAFLGQLRSGQSIERVSFYLGFSMEGLIAYDINVI